MPEGRSGCVSWQQTDGLLDDAARGLRDLLPDDAIVTNGAGNFTRPLHRAFQYRRPGRQLAPAGGSMGYGLPAALAAKLAHPDRAVVCVAGDGDLMMTVQELATIAHHHLAVVVLAIDNRRDDHPDASGTPLSRPAECNGAHQPRLRSAGRQLRHGVRAHLDCDRDGSGAPHRCPARCCVARPSGHGMKRVARRSSGVHRQTRRPPMSLTAREAETWAATLVAARTSGHLLRPGQLEHRPRPRRRLYAIQRAVTATRVRRGETIVGWKLGYTSLAMREQMGIDPPNFGPLTDAMLLRDGEPTMPLIQPCV